MTTALGPYEPRGAYGVLAESEVFDTSGTGSSFCPSCEHEPCVADGIGFCESDPRFISVHHLVLEVEAAANKHLIDSPPLWKALATSIIRIQGNAWTRDYAGDRAIWTLATMRDHLTAPTARSTR